MVWDCGKERNNHVENFPKLTHTNKEIICGAV